MKIVVPLAILILSGCAGTVMTLKGQVCGQDVDLQLVDKKDRSGFDATVQCPGPGGGSLHISSTDSSTSAVVNALSAAMASLTQLVAKVAGTAAP